MLNRRIARPKKPICLSVFRQCDGTEDGAILVVWVVALTALMGLVAMAVDLGNIAQTKQHAANAARDAALSAVVDLAPLAPGGTGTAAVAEAQTVSDAENYLSRNYTSLPPSTAVTAAATYDSCGNALPSSMYFVPGENCIGFFDPVNPADNATTPNAIAVAVPARTVDYTFGQVVGLHSQKVSAVAYASMQTASKDYILPFGYPVAGGSGLQCVTDTSGGSSPCPGFTAGTGQFGVTQSPRYEIFPGNSTANGNNPVTETNLTLGIDHPLSAYNQSDPTSICDWPSTLKGCNSNNGTAPHLGGDYLNPATGQSISEMTGPLFTGGVTTPGGSCTLAPRFSQPDGFTPSSTCAMDQPSPASGDPSGPDLSATEGDTFSSTYTLNGVPIAAYLNSYGKTVTQTCLLPVGGTGTAIDTQSPPGSGVYVWADYDSCLSTLISSGQPSPIFSASLEGSPRFGIVPVIGSSSGGNVEQVTGFDAVYLDVAFPHAGKVGAILSWVFPISLIQGQDVGSGSGVGTDLGGPYVVNSCAYGVNC